jgi:hypothetical protein
MPPSSLRENAARRGRTCSSLLGVLLVAGILVLSAPPSAGAPPSVRRERWFTTLATSLAGCAFAKSQDPVFSTATDLGRWKGSSHALSCPASRGGHLVPSVAQIAAQLQVNVPVRITGRTTGVEVAWNLSLNLTDSGSTAVTGFRCPLSYYNYSYYDAFYNYTEVYRYVSADCYVEGSAQLTGSTALVDETTGASYYGSTWSGLSNTSGFQIDWYEYTENYSGNASFYGSNTTVGASYNASWGPGGSLVGTFLPVWWINGSFVARDRYEVESSLDLEVTSQTLEVPGAEARAALDARSAGGHLDLVQVKVL